MIVEFLYNQHRSRKIITASVLFKTDIFPKCAHPHCAFFWKSVRLVGFFINFFLSSFQESKLFIR